MSNNFNPSELEKRLSEEIFSKIKDKKRIDVTQEMIEKFKQERVQFQAEQQRLKEVQVRQITWIARIIIMPLFILFLGYVLLIGNGLILGEIVGISKYSHYKIWLSQAPMMFWSAVFYHSLIVLFLGFSVYCCWQRAKWFKNKNL